MKTFAFQHDVTAAIKHLPEGSSTPPGYKRRPDLDAKPDPQLKAIYTKQMPNGTPVCVTCRSELKELCCPRCGIVSWMCIRYGNEE